MSQRLIIILQSIVLFVFGLIFIWFYIFGRIDKYLTSAGSFQIQALMAGLFLSIISGFLLLTSSKKVSCAHDHDHSEMTLGGMVLTSLIVLIPVIISALYTPDAYSKNWVQNNSTGWGKGVIGETPEAFNLKNQVNDKQSIKSEGESEGSKTKAVADAAGWGPYTIDDLKQQVDQNDDGEFLMDVISIFYTGGDEEVQGVVKGLPVETMGQVMPETMHNSEGKRIRIFRLMMNCCIADARPVSIPVEFSADVPSYKEMGWYKIHGVMDYEQWDEFTIPVLKANKMIPTEEPPQSAFGQRQ